MRGAEDKLVESPSPSSGCASQPQRQLRPQKAVANGPKLPSHTLRRSAWVYKDGGKKNNV